MPQSKGFTLIELLVVISILGILSTIGFTVYSDVLPKTRDAQRKNDLLTISRALEIYYNKYGYYPTSGGSSSSTVAIAGIPVWITGSSSQPSMTTVTDALPIDSQYNDVQPWVIAAPSGNSINPGSRRLGYFYKSDFSDCNGTAPSQYYILGAILERDSDPDIQDSPGKWKSCNGSNLPSAFTNTHMYIINSDQFH